MAKFDYTSKCANARLCSKLMKEFIADASDLSDEIEIGELTVERKRFISLTKGRCGFRAYVGATKIRIEYDFQSMAKNDVGQSEFRRNITMRDASLRGFSDVTLSLLHELGHFETEGDVPFGYDRFKAQKDYRKWCGDDLRLLNLMYFSLPDEWLATQWAIDWLSDEDNRKRAKQFERDFFKAWRGE